MPTVRQTMLQDRTKEEGADGREGHANKHSLKKAFRFSPSHHGSPETTEILIRGTYYDAVSGRHSHDASDFPDGVDMDYGTSEGTPSDKTVPSGIFDPEASVFKDNTIVPGGKGPTVATLDMENPPSEEDPGPEPIDGSFESIPPFEAPQNDGDIEKCSKNIAAGSFYGGEVGTIGPGASGDPGESNA